VDSANWGTFDPAAWSADHAEEVGYNLDNLIHPLDRFAVTEGVDVRQFRQVFTQPKQNNLNGAFHAEKCADPRLHPCVGHHTGEEILRGDHGLQPKEEYAGGVIYECGGTRDL